MGSSAPQINQPLLTLSRGKGAWNAAPSQSPDKGQCQTRVWQLLCQPWAHPALIHWARPAWLPCLNLTHFESACLPQFADVARAFLGIQPFFTETENRPGVKCAYTFYSFSAEEARRRTQFSQRVEPRCHAPVRPEGRALPCPFSALEEFLPSPDTVCD